MTEFTTSITASSDDAQETTGTVTLTGTTLNANSANQTSGLRFLNVTIPPGSTITAATLTLNLINTTYDDPDVTITAEANVSPATFTTAASNISSRTDTTAAVVWNAGNIGLGQKPTPDLSALVQEVIGLSGWASGNAMAFFIKGNNVNSTLRWSAFDEGTDPPATLAITYTPPAAGSQPARTMHQARMN